MARAVLCTVALAALCVAAASAACPFARFGGAGGSVDRAMADPKKAAAYEPVDYDAVAADIKAMLTVPQAFWPPDYGNYGPFFIRMAWHCTGSYRLSDGRGGCDGGNLRFEPVRSWPDNTNLDKALLLLEGVKQKYGPALSWGDLIVLAGTTAIESMGGPTLGFCGGRIDDDDGYHSLELGPTTSQERIMPCAVNGECESPLGTSTIGLIYVNPEGVMGNHDPVQSVPNIRDVFGRMGMNDTETVALIGGGHAFGRTHGACPAGAGPTPQEDPYNPYPGLCSNGTFTSGLDGPWTATPTTWTNSYFRELLNFKWELVPAPSGHKQFEPVAGQGAPPVMMLTTDIALLHDTTYKGLVNTFASDIHALDDQFAHAWYKLVTRDMGPVTRCVGNNIPPAQPWQFPLPTTSPNASTIATARSLLKQALYNGGSYSDPVNGQNYQGALFVQLAWQSASTFRHTDYRGGANGATIRFPPQKDWPVNAGMQTVLAQLQPIKDQVGDSLSWADLIVLAGNVALEDAGLDSLPFCAGRGDATDGKAAENLEPRMYITDPIESARDNAKVMGLSAEEFVALQGRLRSPAYMEGLGYSGSWTSNPSNLTNQYFTLLIGEDWDRTPTQSALAPAGSTVTGRPSVTQEYRDASGAPVYITGFDLALKYDPILRRVTENFAADNDLFVHHFREAWTKIMNADRFDGPLGNVCYGQ